MVSRRVATFRFVVILAVLSAGACPASAQSNPDWLTYLNAYRASAGLPALVHEPAWSAADVLHARYTVKEDVLAHSENSTSPWYTAEGHTAAQNSNVMASSGSTTTDQFAIDLWMQGPFHAVGMIDPRLARTGFGSYREADGSYQMAAALDVLRGRSGSLAGVAWPVLWPGPGRTVPIGRYSGNEYPNPITGCPGYTAPTGLPLIAQFGSGSTNPVVTGSSLSANGQPLEHCVFSETTYTNGDASAQSLGRSVLGSRDAVVLIPRAPLVSGTTYTASLTVNGLTQTWSFTIGAFADTSCTISVSPQSVSLTSAAAIRTFAVSASPSSCSWSASSGVSWLTITSGSSGTGNGTVTVGASSNSTFSARAGTLTIGGQSITITQSGQAPFTSDNDGLDDAWELSMGLSPSSGSGDDGPGGDPDHDGLTNQQELTANSHPRGFHTRYFAEGATISQMRTRFALLNPHSGPARVLMRFARADASIVTQALTIPAHTRSTLDAETLSQLTSAEFSTTIESDVDIVADRTVRWDFGSPGSHAETAIVQPELTWYFAEGATHSGFDLFYLLQNPSTTERATVRVRYLRPAAAPLEKTYTVEPGSRFNIWVDTERFPVAGGEAPLLEATDVSTVIEVLAGPAVIAERSMYLSRAGQTFLAGHASAGVPAPQTRWFLAEGATGTFFDMFALVANPTTQAAQVRATYLLSNGTTLTKDYRIEPQSRYNIWVDAEDIPGHGRALADTSLSIVFESTNGVPVIAERAMWWPGPTAAQWTEAHNAAGAVESGTLWALAEGESGGSENTETYVLIANVGAQSGEALVTVWFEDETSAELHVPLLPNSRTTVPVGASQAGGGFGSSVANRRFGITVESLAHGGTATPVIVERAMYSSPSGRTWAAGTSALGTKLQ
ncbi:MAG: CAP domain-containing protein [Vicinamibacterales bacterium]